MKLSIPGTTKKRSPDLITGVFPLPGNATYTFSARIKTSGLSNGLTVYLIQRNASGAGIQTGLQSQIGTSGWTTKNLAITTRPDTVEGYLKIYISSGYGTAWLDDIQLTGVFGTNVPLAFGGSVSGSGGVLTQTASKNGFDLSATYTSVGSAIKVDATVTDTSGSDRTLELTYRLPLDVPGWTWDNDFVTPVTIASGTRYEYLDKYFGLQTKGHTHSVYPFATVHNAAASFGLSVPMGPLMYRFSYDDFHGFRITWDLGLSPLATKNPSRAKVSFWITTQHPKWGMRATAEKYYALNPSSFSTPATALGAWVLGNSRPISSVPDWQDFGWEYHEQDDELNFDNSNGIQALHYINPSAWGRDFSEYEGVEEIPYDVLIAALTSDLTSTKNTEDGVPVSKMAKAVFDTAPYDENGLQQLHYNGLFWRGTRQYYPMLPDPEIPGGRYAIAKQYSVDARIAAAQNAGNTLDGIFLDNIGLTFANVENYRKSLWAHLDTPLSFSYATRRVTAYSGDPIAAFCETLRAYLHGKGMILMGSSSAVSYSWFAHLLDVVGGETQGDDPIDKSYTRLALGYRKPWSNLFVPPRGDGPPTAAEVLTYLREALFFGFFPGMNGVYWDTPSAYERDRALFKQYTPLIRTITQAKWNPINAVVSSDTAIFVERWGDPSGTFYLTAHNSSTSTKSFQLTVDGAWLGLGSGAATVKELLGNTTLSGSRSGLNVLFSDTLSTGETAVYEVTVAGGCDATYGDLNVDGRADATDLVILSHYLVGNVTPGAAPFTAALAKADCDRSGTVDAVDLVVLQNFLAGNLTCLPK
jgi:hypothetical protein